MKGFMTHQAIRRRGLYFGLVPEVAAAGNGSTLLTLDHDLDVLPGVGRRLTVAELAFHVDDLAGRLWAAGVRPGEHVAIYKSANVDVWVLATAAARVGAVPVMLSPALDAATVRALLGRLDRPKLLTDLHKLDVLADEPVAELTAGVIVVAGSRPGAASLAELAGSARVQPVVRPQDEPAMITHTSGTTGLPKLVAAVVAAAPGDRRDPHLVRALPDVRGDGAGAAEGHAGPAHAGVRPAAGRPVLPAAPAGVGRGAAELADGVGASDRGSAEAVRVGEVLQQHVRRGPSPDDGSAAGVVRAAGAAVLPDLRAERGRPGGRPAVLPQVRPSGGRALCRLGDAGLGEGPGGQPGRQTAVEDQPRLHRGRLGRPGEDLLR